ncbi:Hypothetical predicted protein, partial [Marmota monax]
MGARVPGAGNSVQAACAMVYRTGSLMLRLSRHATLGRNISKTTPFAGYSGT